MSLDEEGWMVADPTAEHVAEHRLIWRDALLALDALAEEQRVLLLLVGVEDFSYEAAAQLTGVPVAPDLAPLGYSLLGGRLLAGAAGDPAAQLMYAGPGAERLTVYLRADRAGGAGTEFRFAEVPAQGVAAFWWVDRGFGFAVAADGLEREALQRVAESVQRQVARSHAL